MATSIRGGFAARTWRRGTGLALCWLLLGCASYKGRNHLSYHVLPVGSDGELGEFAFDEPLARNGRAVPRGSDLREHAGIILKQARVETDRRRAATGLPLGGAVPLMVAIHGGRNTPGSAARRDDELLRVLNGEDLGSRERPWHYPVFVDWRSGDFTTLWGRLSRLRQGRDLSGIWGWLSMPVLVVHDVTRGVIRLPRSLLYGLFRDGSVATRVATGWSPVRSWRDAERIAHAMETPDITGWERPFDLRAADFHRSTLAHGARLLTYFPTQLTKIPLQSLVLEGLGQGAWDVMRRRASHLVRTPMTYELDTHGRSDESLREFYGAGTVEGSPAVDGALPLLFASMAAGGDTIELTLVAHSMGAIAINESLGALGQAIESSTGRIDVKRIVYMAPACSVIDAANALVPFLEQHPQTQFHLLTLHPIAEADEYNFYDLVPRGSLLEWIDVFYSRQATHGERVFGKWANAVPAIGLFESVRDQVHVKAFDVDGDSYPQKHGQFFEIPFWRPEAYETSGAPNFSSDWLGVECGRADQRCREEGRSTQPW